MYSVIYENSDFVVVSKEAGVLTVADRYDPAKPCLKAALEVRYGKIFVVHRLDKETSGLVCFARNEHSHKKLNKEFETKSAIKTYRLCVHGRVLLDKFIIDKRIKASRSGKGRMTIDPSGKESITKFKLIESFRHFSYLEAEPVTGRTHQIRVHIQYTGHSVVADKLYSRTVSLRLSDFKKDVKGESAVLINRQALHAFKLKMADPVKNEKLEFVADLPKDMAVLLKILRKYDR